ncbi:MAG: FkbM family methyltransferase [Rhodospirillales bacterium]|nr:FkbM family methyltransferase [Rhodospirillales bacterium]
MKPDNLFSDLAIGRLARDHPLSYIDIGLRGGFQEDLSPLAFAVNAFGFEPDPQERARLDAAPAGPWMSSRILPHAIGATSGRQKLFVPTDPQSASLLEHNPEIGEKFRKPQFFEIEEIIDVDTVTLAEAARSTGIGSVDYIKIDIEGAEMGVFEASPRVMDRVLAVKTEVSFLPVRHDQPLAHDVEAYFKERHFDLMDVIQPAHWRRQGYQVHPYMSREKPPYSRGQLIQADHLYFRDPQSLGNDIGALTKLALISMAFGYFDNALMIFEQPELCSQLRRTYGVSPLELVHPASRKYGRKMFLNAAYRQFRGLVPFLRYFKHY